MPKDTTGWAVTGVGAAVTGIGALVGGTLGAGIAGFGLAHVVLGILDNFRPIVRKR
ncbi:MAG: hypothetical protein QHH10_06185 [Peptococcaceae bacterium]|jgi:hypothetical protein|nr:hypothetical protein [Peptococcaceae bacterium]MDH7524886.1 hypothetical protein [Peptococcaceae bacterium]